MPIAEAASWAEKLTVEGMQRKICELEIWIAEINEKVIGWGAIRGDRLEGLYTDPEFAGRGIGTELLAMLEGLDARTGYFRGARRSKFEGRSILLSTWL